MQRGGKVSHRAETFKPRWGDFGDSVHSGNKAREGPTQALTVLAFLFHLVGPAGLRAAGTQDW